MQDIHVSTVNVGDSSPLGRATVLYPRAYLVFIVLSALDVIFTWCILHTGGIELNVIARIVILNWDLYGLLVYKFSLVSLVLIICETVGRHRWRTGRRLSHFAVGLTAVPVVTGIVVMLLALSRIH